MTRTPFRRQSAVRFIRSINAVILRDVQSYLRHLSERRPPTPEEDAAWECFYQVCVNALRRYLASCQVRRDEWDDCIQAIWQEVSSAMPKFERSEHPLSFFGWLRRIAFVKAAQIDRYHARHTTIPLTDEIASGLIDQELANEIHESRQAAIDQALADLQRRVSPTSYKVFCLHCCEGWSIRRIAAELHLQPNEVSYRCSRTKRKLDPLLRASLGRSGDA